MSLSVVARRLASMDLTLLDDADLRRMFGVPTMTRARSYVRHRQTRLGEVERVPEPGRALREPAEVAAEVGDVAALGAQGFEEPGAGREIVRAVAHGRAGSAPRSVSTWALSWHSAYSASASLSHTMPLPTS